MVDKRSKQEIYQQILRTIKNGVVKPTRIMYDSNLSWKPIKEMLQSFEEQGLIENRFQGYDKRGRKQYYITQKGENFLFYLDQIEGLMVMEVANLQ